MFTLALCLSHATAFLLPLPFSCHCLSPATLLLISLCILCYQITVTEDTKGIVGPNTSWKHVQFTKVRLLSQLFGLRPWYCKLPEALHICQGAPSNALLTPPGRAAIATGRRLLSQPADVALEYGRRLMSALSGMLAQTNSL
jgi:hypothetical protein